ncbi:MAG: 3-oxo-4,17-pregnadiene-20-carboxyl-CoA hydratase alpha subunit, partial [Pseudonocardiales bacterium]|nr:3-oxo-4,17-pregnadiene-20-carboxyl-CoA hydratase alpha subunit [Pseudonocardiales bacterium]
MINAPDVAELFGALPGPDAPLARSAEVPVSEHAIRTWCAAVGERNPIHYDDAAARRAGYPGVVAPPAMLQTWTMPIGERSRAERPTLHARVRRLAQEAGLGAVVATDYAQEYLRPIRPGELLAERSWVDSVSGPKTTALGSGRFVTVAFEIFDEDGVAVGRMTARTLYFAPGSPRSTGRPPPPVEDVAGATELAPLEVPLSRTLIVAASLASNDHEPVHHDHEVARGQGLPDVIASIVTTAGLVLRYAGERSAPGARCRALRLRLARPAFPG